MNFAWILLQFFKQFDNNNEGKEFIQEETLRGSLLEFQKVYGRSHFMIYYRDYGDLQIFIRGRIPALIFYLSVIHLEKKTTR